MWIELVGASLAGMRRSSLLFEEIRAASATQQD
jgi:hypothetical protein